LAGRDRSIGPRKAGTQSKMRGEESNSYLLTGLLRWAKSAAASGRVKIWKFQISGKGDRDALRGKRRREERVSKGS